MEVLTEFKGLVEGQLVRNQGTLAIIRYFVKEDDALVAQREDGHDYCFVRITLVDSNGKPFADTTQAISELRDFHNRPF